MSHATIGQASPIPLSHFSIEDHSAPTAFIAPEPSQRNHKQLADEGVLAKAPPRRGLNLVSLLTVMVLSIVLVFLLIAGVVFFAFQPGLTATITVRPQVHAVEHVFTITARPDLSKPVSNNTAIPLYTLPPVNKTLTQTVATTGQQFFCFIDCPRTVSSDDVNTLGSQISQTLEAQLTQNLQAQLQAKNATQVGDPSFTYVNHAINPPVGTVSDKVTITITEQASVKYILNNEARGMASSLLQQQVQQQYGSGYSLVSSLTQIGQTVVQGTDTNGIATLQIAAGGVAEYQFSQNAITDMQNHIKGMKSNAALARLKNEPGVDPGIITVHLDYGDTLPNNIQQIKIMPIDPTKLPSVTLPTLQPTVTPSPVQ